MSSYYKEKLNILFLISHLAKIIGQPPLPYSSCALGMEEDTVVMILLAVCNTNSEKN